MDQPAEKLTQPSAETPKLPERKHRPAEIRYYADNYILLQSQLRSNSAKTLFDYQALFNAGTLQQLVGDATSFDFNFNYSNLTSLQNDGMVIKDVLLNALQLMQVFGVKNTSYFATKDKKTGQAIPFYQNKEIEYQDDILPEEHMVMAWLLSAHEWAHIAISPLLTNLKGSEIVLSAGGQYEMSKSADGTNNPSRETCQLLSSIQVEITEYIAKMKKYFHDHNPELYLRADHHLTKIDKLSPLPGTLDLEACRSPHESLIRITIQPFWGEIKPYQHGDVAVAIGLIFIAQQEISFPIAKRNVFNKIKALFPDWDNTKLESIIKSYHLVRDQARFSEEVLEEYPLERPFYSLLRDKLHEIVVKDKLNKLAQDLFDNVCAKDNSIWLDIEYLFLTYYEKGEYSKNPMVRYVCLDADIRNCIHDAVNKMRIIEQATGEKLVETQRKPSHLTNRGLWRIIAYLLVSANTHTGKNQLSPENLIKDNADIFSNMTLSDLQQAINFYLNGTDYYPGIAAQIQANIKAAMDYVLKNYKEEHLVVRPSPKKLVSERGWQYLRGYLLKHFAKTPSVQVDAKDGPIANSSIHKSAITSTPSSIVRQEYEIDRKFISEKMPLRTTPHLASSLKDHFNNRDYGTNAAVIITDGTQSTHGEKKLLPEKTQLQIPVNQHALANCIFSAVDITSVVEQHFNVRMVFLNDSKSVLKAKQLHAMNLQQAAIYLTEGDQYSIDVYIDPFPRCSAYITQKMIAYTQTMISAQLSKQEISSLFKPMCAAIGGFFQGFSSTEDKKYSQYAKQIVDKCHLINTTVEDVLELIKSLLPIIFSNTDFEQKYNNLREDFLSRANYIFYRSEGKSCAEIAALNKSIEIHPFSIEEGSKWRSKPGRKR